MSILPNASRAASICRHWTDRVRALARDVRGVTSIEYVLLASLIAVTIAGICTEMFSKLSAEYGEIAAIFN